MISLEVVAVSTQLEGVQSAEAAEARQHNSARNSKLNKIPTRMFVQTCTATNMMYS